MGNAMTPVIVSRGLHLSLPPRLPPGPNLGIFFRDYGSALLSEIGCIEVWEVESLSFACLVLGKDKTVLNSIPHMVVKNGEKTMVESVKNHQLPTKTRILFHSYISWKKLFPRCSLYGIFTYIW